MLGYVVCRRHSNEIYFFCHMKGADACRLAGLRGARYSGSAVHFRSQVAAWSKVT